MNVAVNVDQLARVRGSGFGGGGKGGSQSATNDRNTLRSKASFNLIEAISEGPIYGLVDGLKSIYFDQTAVQNADGSFNFKNIEWVEHKGYADEGYFNGHSAVETTVNVETQVKQATGPVVRTIVDENADAVRVIIRIPSLVQQDDSGGLKATSVSYAIDRRNYNGSWQEVLVNNLTNEKCLSPAQIAHRIDLPYGGGPWDIRVRRLTADTSDDKLQNDTFWEGYVVLVEGKFIYPNTAAIAIKGNAEDMGSNVPPRSYRVKGLLVHVPSNYDPFTRTYTGLWDGTFKIAWTNNPAWVFYDLLVNDRYGLGEFIKPEIVDKWSLYTIARYCDEPVKSGYKNGDTGADIYEPRFTFNGVINSKDEAFFVLQSITQAWRGMGYWALGQVFATADMPTDPVRLVSPANVIGGDFDYQGTALKARHSVVMVKWNNPDDFYHPDTEVVIDSNLLHKYGWRDKTIQLTGCTSRGLAHRYGKWVIDTEQNETETVTYSASWDHAELRPGDVIAISDPRKAQIRAAGRVANHFDNVISLDHDFEYLDGQSYQLMLTMPNGSIETRNILAFLDDRTVRVSAAFSDTALPDAMWTIKGTDITPRLYRVLSVDEEEANIFKVTALSHDPTKYARVEQDITLEPLPYERPSKTVSPPTNLKVAETGYISNGQAFQSLTVSWSPPSGQLVRGFVVTVTTPEAATFILGTVQTGYIEMPNTQSGIYKFQVQSIGYTGVLSAPAEVSYEALGIDGFLRPTVTDLQLVDNPSSDLFTGQDLKVKWQNNFAISNQPGSAVTSSSPHYAYNTVKVYDGATGIKLREEIRTSSYYEYGITSNRADCIAAGLPGATRSIRIDVTVNDVFGRVSDVASKVFKNPVPAVTVPTVSVFGTTLYIAWPPSEDLDAAGTMVWVSRDEDFDPLTTDPAFDGQGNFFTFKADVVGHYYIRAATYDAFGKEGLNISPVVTALTLIDRDTTPPAVPTGLALSSIAQPDGSVILKAEWNANSEDDLAYYDLQLRQGEGGWLSFPTSANLYQVATRAGLSYEAAVRAIDRSGNISNTSAIVHYTVTADTEPPAIPVGLTAMGLFRSIWVDWDLVADADLAFYELEITKSGLSNIAQVAAPAFIHSDLLAGDAYAYRVRAVDVSGNRSDWSDPASAVVGQINGADLPPDAIVSSFALIDQAFIESAQIVEIDAAKIKAGSVLAGTVKVSTGAGNFALSDPAAGVNAGTTTIDPGKIVISGETTLASWRDGTDQTKINGGSISANSISANALKIGGRGLVVTGLQFSVDPTNGTISWTSGSLAYINDDGDTVTKTIAAGSFAHPEPVAYVYWSKDADTLTGTEVSTDVVGGNKVLMATWSSAAGLQALYSATIIEGTRIKTGSITADKIAATTLSSIAADIGTITAGVMASTDGKMRIDLNNRRILIAD